VCCLSFTTVKVAIVFRVKEFQTSKSRFTDWFCEYHNDNASCLVLPLSSVMFQAFADISRLRHSVVQHGKSNANELHECDMCRSARCQHILSDGAFDLSPGNYAT
jgi:hypothetical protein